MKKMISWNVNGLRACMKKGFQEYFEAADADIFCLQETKLQEGQIDLELPGYHQYWNYAEKKGYSGTALFTKEEPISVRYGIGIEEHDTEGRVITAEFPEYFVVTVYTPNSQDELKRLAYRMEWEDAFLSYLKGLEQEKPVIFCGDLNVAATEMDIKNAKANEKNAGFTKEEREKFAVIKENRVEEVAAVATHAVIKPTPVITWPATKDEVVVAPLKMQIPPIIVMTAARYPTTGNTYLVASL